MESNRQQLRDLLKSLLATRPDEIDCDVLLSSVGALLESLQRNEDPPSELAFVLQHLEICPECREEFEALLRVHEIPIANLPKP